MNSATVLLVLKASLALMVLGVGLNATPQDTTYLLRHRALLVRSFIAMDIIMPLAALWMAIVFALHPAVKIALVALALSPVPPLLPNKVAKAGGHGSYTIGLLVVTSLAAIVIIPVAVWLLGTIFGHSFRVPVAPIVKLVGGGLLLPLGAGIGIRHFAPALATRAARPVALIAVVVLVAAIIPVLLKVWPAMQTLVFNGTVAAIVLLTLVGLIAGHFLGGPESEDRTVLGLATCSRHPAVALVILAATFPDEKLAPAAVLLAVLAGAIASTPYTLWRKRQLRPAVSGQLTPAAQ